MNLIFFSRREGRARHFNLAHPMVLGGLGVIAVGILVVAFMLGIRLGERSASNNVGNRASVAQSAHERTALDTLRRQTQDRVDALALRLGQMNAHMIRLDALGKRLTQMANISSREFNFDSEPPVGGPESAGDFDGMSAQVPDLTVMLDGAQRRLDQRDAQLVALENVILSRKLTEAIQPDGRPVAQGYISSYFGGRADPFDGHDAYHKGMDFAGQAGAEVISVAAGVVTWAENRNGYGTLVEVNHGNGYITRYGHNQSTLVKAGQTVTRGQPLALMGSTGRSTGPHVHFEVLKDGRQVNPQIFIGR
ncbi:MAG: M23 family metallopeptidase [Steroidobacteraceae bacterium]